MQGELSHCRAGWFRLVNEYMYIYIYIHIIYPEFMGNSWQVAIEHGPFRSLIYTARSGSEPQSASNQASLRCYRVGTSLEHHGDIMETSWDCLGLLWCFYGVFAWCFENGCLMRLVTSLMGRMNWDLCHVYRCIPPSCCIDNHWFMDEL